MSLLLIALAGAAAATLPGATPLCQDTSPRPATATRAGGVHPLSQEPNADAVLTVLRRENGCSRPVRIREDIGTRRR